MKKLIAYLQEVTKEMRKVTWPKRKELIESTVITLLASVLLSLFIFGADQGISSVYKTIISWAG